MKRKTMKQTTAAQILRKHILKLIDLDDLNEFMCFEEVYLPLDFSSGEAIDRTWKAILDEDYDGILEAECEFRGTHDDELTDFYTEDVFKVKNYVIKLDGKWIVYPYYYTEEDGPQRWCPLIDEASNGDSWIERARFLKLVNERKVTSIVNGFPKTTNVKTFDCAYQFRSYEIIMPNS